MIDTIVLVCLIAKQYLRSMMSNCPSTIRNLNINYKIVMCYEVDPQPVPELSFEFPRFINDFRSSFET